MEVGVEGLGLVDGLGFGGESVDDCFEEDAGVWEESVPCLDY